MKIDLNRIGLAVLAACLGLGASASTVYADDEAFCPPVFDKGALHLDFNPAFLHVDAYDSPTGKKDGLTVSSFFNAYVVPGGTPPLGFFERDQVARIEDLSSLCVNGFDPATDLEVLTDLSPGMPKTVWPNEASRAPDDVFPFEAVVIPQGFHPAPFAGRLTAVNLDDPARTEYVIHQSTLDYSLPPQSPGNAPRFYHAVEYFDMDGDGLRDIVTVRSGFKVGGPYVHPPFSELVYFRNPGAAIDPNTPWQEVVLYGGPMVGFMGPDIHLEMQDFEGDGIPEIVATHFFTGDPAAGNGPPTKGKISIYGAPANGDWSVVNTPGFPIRVADISTDQGFPFGVGAVDLNNDGRMDILATNHQPDGCTFPTMSAVPGRVYALTQPASGDIFGDAWETHILLDNIRPQPSLPPFSPPGRLAPGHAFAFQPHAMFEGRRRPHIVVGGDEAGKVWILRPTSADPEDWNYESAVIFDINDAYGANTTQTPMFDPFGITISTIGQVAVRHDAFGFAEIYVPVFEARDIHVFSYRPSMGASRVQCPADVNLSCGG